MLSQAVRKNLKKQQYGLVGEHSAVKICSWTKKSIKNKGVCYKEKFYGIKSHRCCQITPNLSCSNRCVFCWRDLSTPTIRKWRWKTDDAKTIINGCVEAHRKLLIGFKGNKDADKRKLKQAFEPNQFAISLSGEPLMYPKMNDIVKELNKKGASIFVVTNGMFPKELSRLRPVTQLYVSVDAPNKELFEKIDKPIFKDGWDRLNKSLSILLKKSTKQNTCLRITLIKGLNMTDIPGYCKLIKKAMPTFIEVKAYMFVGSSRQRLEIKNMPLHSEVKEFAERIVDELSRDKKTAKYKIRNEQKESRVVLVGH